MPEISLAKQRQTRVRCWAKLVLLFIGFSRSHVKLWGVLSLIRKSCHQRNRKTSKETKKKEPPKDSDWRVQESKVIGKTLGRYDDQGLGIRWTWA